MTTHTAGADSRPLRWAEEVEEVEVDVEEEGEVPDRDQTFFSSPVCTQPGPSSMPSCGSEDPCRTTPPPSTPCTSDPPQGPPGYIVSSERRQWLHARRDFMITASCVPDVLHCGWNSRHVALMRKLCDLYGESVIPRRGKRKGKARAARERTLLDGRPASPPPGSFVLNKETLAIMEMGRLNEPLIHAAIAPPHIKPGLLILKPHATLRWMACSPDALDLGARVGYEVMNAPPTSLRPRLPLTPLLACAGCPA